MTVQRRRRHVYEPESPLRHPSRLLRTVVEEVWQSRQLIWQLLVRDLRSRYRESILGWLWIFVPPVVAAIGLSIARSAEVVRFGDTSIPYGAYVLISFSLWQVFTEALGAPLQGMTSARPLLAKIRVPPEAILLSKAAQVGVGAAVKVLLIVAAFVWFGLSVPSGVVLAPLPLLALIILGLGFGTALGCVGSLYRDVSSGMPFLTMAWLFVTPVIYAVPPNRGFGVLVAWNPVTPLLVATRELATLGTISNPGGLIWAAAGSVLLLLASAIVLRISQPFLIERISA